MILLIDNFDSFTYNLYHFVAGSPALQQYAHQHRDMQQRCDMPQRCAEREGNGDSNGAGSATGVAGGKPAVQVAVSYTHLTLPTKPYGCRSRWSPYH